MSDNEGSIRPDLVLVMTDQQRYDQVGYASNGHFETPNLDALANDGVVFESAYSASTVCVPARMALLTGLLPHRLPTQENRFALREGFWTAVHELRRAGYETALIGKMHFAPVHADHGFETMRLCEHLARQGLGPLSRERGDVFDDYHYWLLDHGVADRRLERDAAAAGPSSLPAHAHPTAWIEREVTSFLSSRDPTRPLFLVISFPHPHSPYDPPAPYATMYDPAESVLPPTGFEVNEGLPWVFSLATAASPTRDEAANERAVRRHLAIVRGLVRQIDDALGRVVAQLDLESTIIFFTSDHGDYAGQRGLMRKNPWIPFDDLARVPLVVSGGRLTGGRRIPELVQSCDIPLTCLDLAGVARPDGVEFDSRSLVPIIEDVAGLPDLERAVFSATSLEWPMIRLGRHKYIKHIERAGVLFDLEDDPLERENLALDPERAELCEHLAERLRVSVAQPVLDLPARR